MERMIELLDEACQACTAVLDYLAMLNKGPGRVSEREFKEVMRRMFTHAQNVEEMRLRNLRQALDEEPFELN